jgi:hypothetical protein
MATVINNKKVMFKVMLNFGFKCVKYQHMRVRYKSIGRLAIYLALFYEIWN